MPQAVQPGVGFRETQHCTQQVHLIGVVLLQLLQPQLQQELQQLQLAQFQPASQRPWPYRSGTTAVAAEMSAG